MSIQDRKHGHLFAEEPLRSVDSSPTNHNSDPTAMRPRGTSITGTVYGWTFAVVVGAWAGASLTLLAVWTIIHLYRWLF